MEGAPRRDRWYYTEERKEQEVRRTARRTFVSGTWRVKRSLHATPNKWLAASEVADV
jgi:hypothetical protein